MAVPEQVRRRKQPFLEQLVTTLVVAASPIVAVREVETVDVPLVRVVLCGDDLGGQLEGTRDARAA